MTLAFAYVIVLVELPAHDVPVTILVALSLAFLADVLGAAHEISVKVNN
jgi:hypothetical protein